MGKKIIIFSAPSGSGKSTIVSHLLDTFPQLEFSVSATSRAPRGQEKHGRDYYFMTYEEFKNHIENNDFVEWEEVYPGTCYGTLRNEMERIWSHGRVIVFDVDVKGGLHLKRIFGDRALSVFIMPPSLHELEKRLVGRGTDSADTIVKRLNKAAEELAYAPQFDRIIVNDDLETALKEAGELVAAFIDS